MQDPVGNCALPRLAAHQHMDDGGSARASIQSGMPRRPPTDGRPQQSGTPGSAWGDSRRGEPARSDRRWLCFQSQAARTAAVLPKPVGFISVSRTASSQVAGQTDRRRAITGSGPAYLINLRHPRAAMEATSLGREIRHRKENTILETPLLKVDFTRWLAILSHGQCRLTGSSL